MSPGRVAKRGVASACHDEALNAKEEVSCATDEIKRPRVVEFSFFPLKHTGACYAGWLLQHACS